MPVKKIKKMPTKRKIIKKKPVKKAAISKTKPKTKPAKLKKTKPAPLKITKNIIGIISHYFPKVQAAVVKIKTPLSTGDNIKIKGHTTDFTQTVDSIQIDRVAIKTAKKGQEIGLLVNSRVRQGDIVYKILEEENKKMRLSAVEKIAKSKNILNTR